MTDDMSLASARISKVSWQDLLWEAKSLGFRLGQFPELGESTQRHVAATANVMVLDREQKESANRIDRASSESDRRKCQRTRRAFR